MQVRSHSRPDALLNDLSSQGIVAEPPDLPDVPGHGRRSLLPLNTNFKFPSLFSGLPHYPENRYLSISHQNQNAEEPQDEISAQLHGHGFRFHKAGLGEEVGSDHLCIPALLSLLVVLLPPLVTLGILLLIFSLTGNA